MKEPSSNRKEEIVFNALQIISEEGVKNLTMKDLGGRIGISDAALYRHFKNKQEIVLAMIETVGRNLTINISNAVANIEGPVDKL